MSINENQIEIIRKVLDDNLAYCAYHCTRCWTAWGVGTMTKADFEEINVDEIMDAIVKELNT